MSERILNQISSLRSGRISTTLRIYFVFVVIYIFLSGFVFIEPSPAEIWFLFFVPFILMHFKTNFESLLSFGLVFIPMLISTYVGYLVSGYYNTRFITIDLYLFFFFLLLVSSFNMVSKEMPAEKLLKTLMIAWAFASLINILAGLIALFTPFRLFPANIVLYGIRMKGFFKDPNVLGPFLVPNALYFLRELFYSKEHRALKFFLFVFISFGILLTFSRAAWLNYAAALFIYLIFAVFDKRTFKKSVVFAMVLILLFIAFLYLSSYIYLFDTNLSDFMFARAKLQSYDEDRFETQSKFLQIISSTSILFGTGPGNYENFTGYATHSLYARYIGERGFFGFALFVIFLGIAIRKASKSELKNFLIPIIIGQLVNSLFIDSLHWRHLWVLLALSFM